jgi:acyl carrier protein
MQLVVAAEDRLGVVLQAADLSKENLGSADALAVLINRRCA